MKGPGSALVLITYFTSSPVTQVVRSLCQDPTRIYQFLRILHNAAIRQRAKALKQTSNKFCSSGFRTRCKSIPVTRCSDLQRSSSTHSNQLAGAQPRRNYKSKLMKPLPTAEETVVQHVIDLNARGFPLRLAAVKDTADSLLAERLQDLVSQKWAANVVKFNQN
jgi:hypothetical protein